MIYKNLKFIICLLVFISIASHSMSKESIAFIDLDFLIKNSNPGKLALENISKIDKKNIDILKKKNKELENLENEIKNKQKIISKEAFAEEVKLLRLKINTYSKEKDEIVKEFNKYKKAELDNVFKKITPVIRKYMDENSIKILMDSKNIFMGKIEVDLTDEILKEINSSIN